MIYVKFVLLFTISHVFSYTVAGSLSLKFSKDIYESKGRLCHFLRDMADPKERQHVEKYFLPAQIIRGFLMGVVLLPLLSSIKNLVFITQFTFFCSLIFVYTHISSASPFIDNIEGQIYFKEEYLLKKAFLKFQIEMVIYAVLFGFIMTLLLQFVV